MRRARLFVVFNHPSRALRLRVPMGSADEPIPIFQTVRIPLTMFGGAAPASFVGLRISFDRTPESSVLLAHPHCTGQFRSDSAAARRDSPRAWRARQVQG